MTQRVGIGQDSHRFLSKKNGKPCVIGGIVFEDVPGMDADSDGDVVYHAICNAITSLTHVPILGKVAVEMCKEGILDSVAYVEKALATLENEKIVHIALTIEGARPKFQPRADEIRQSVATACSLGVEQVGITFTSGDGLTAFGKGEGLMCYALLTLSLFD